MKLKLFFLCVLAGVVTFCCACKEIELAAVRSGIAGARMGVSEELQQRRDELMIKIANEQNPQKRAELNRELQNVEREIQLFQTSGK